MVFAGTRITAPAMAAAQGMKDVALHQATNKTVRPLTEQMAGPVPTVGKDPAGRAAASLPAAGLSELAGGMLPSLPDMVPFP
ncbi:hypothetical protein, partial [Inquilinus limosus]